MSITIKLVETGYLASVRPPNGRISWDTSKPMNRRELIDQLLSLDCHQTDIGDAFYAADPDWLDREFAV